MSGLIPVITSPGAATVPERASGIAYQADAGPLVGSWSLLGPDRGDFTIDSNGAIRFIQIPDFEAPRDNDRNNTYLVTLSASNLFGTATQDVVITVTNVNEAPVFSSATSASFAEGGAGVAYQAQATDLEGDSVSWSLSGADAAEFTMDESGAVRFRRLPDFETPRDAGRNNVYDLVVTASDGTLSSNRAVAITVTNVTDGLSVSGYRTSLTIPETPASPINTPLDFGAHFNMGDGVVPASLVVFGVQEFERAVVAWSGTGSTRITTASPEVRYGGVTIGTYTERTGEPLVVTFNSAVTGEAVEALINSIGYRVFTDAPALTRVLTLDVLDNTGRSLGGPWTPSFTLLEGAANPLAGTAPDADATRLVQTLNLDPSLNPRPAFGDFTGDGAQDFVVGTGDGQLLAWRYTPEAWVPLTGTSNPFAGIDVGADAAPALLDLDGDRRIDLVVGNLEGTLRAWRNTPSGFVEWAGPANPFAGVDVGDGSRPTVLDVDRDGYLDLVVQSAGSGFAVLQNDGSPGALRVTVTVTPEDDLPVFRSSNTATVAENTTGNFLLPAADDADGDILTFSLAGRDAALFAIEALNAWSAGLRFRAPPDFEAPGDADGDNVYELDIIATGNGGATTQSVTVTVTDTRDYARIDDLAGRVSLLESAVLAGPQRFDTDITYVRGDEGPAQLRVTGLDAGDRVVIMPMAGGISLDGAQVSFAGTVIGSWSGGVGGDLVVHLLPGAADAAVEALIESLALGTTTIVPARSRDLQLRLVDPSGEITTRTIEIDIVDRLVPPPVADLALATVENANPVLWRPAAAGAGGWSLEGADAALFEIDATTGALRFRAAPDFERPGDVGGDNIHEVTAVSGGLRTSFAITVQNAVERAQFGGLPTQVTVAENAVNAAPSVLFRDATLTAGDELRGARLEISGLLPEDRLTILHAGDGPGQLGVEGNTLRFGGTQIGVVTENAGGRFGVLFSGGVTEGAAQALLRAMAYSTADDTPTPTRELGLTVVEPNAPLSPTTSRITLNVTPQNDPPVLTRLVAHITVPEGPLRTDVIFNVFDPDGDPFRFFVTGADGLGFSVFNDPLNLGRLGHGGLDFEAPGDADRDNVYHLDISVSDSRPGLNPLVTLVVTVTDVRETPWLFGLEREVTLAENAANGSPLLIDSAIRLQQGDSLTGAVFTVSGLLAEDVVSLRSTGDGFREVSFDGTTLRYEGVAVGTAAGGVGGAFTVTFNAAASVAAVEQTIAALTYVNTSDAPTATRSLTYELVDASGNRLNQPPGTGFTALPSGLDPLRGLVTGTDSRPVLVDFDRDGDLDLVEGNEAGTIDVYRNIGTGFLPLGPADHPFGDIAVGGEQASPPSSAPAFGDIDGDGFVDLVVGSAWDGLVFWRGTAEGFVAGALAGGPFATMVSEPLSLPVLLDFDADGDLDLLAGSVFGSGLQAWRRTAEGFVAVAIADTPFAGISAARAAPAVGDLDGDGDLDLVLTTDLGPLRSFRNDGGSFVELTGAANPLNLVASDRTAPAIGDLDGDGRVDVILPSGNAMITHVIAQPPSITVRVSAQNDAPLGAVRLGLENGLLTATPDLADPDGLGAISIRWQALAGGNWTDIPGATGSGFAPGAAQAGQLLRAVASYTDAGGTMEEVASLAAGQVGTEEGEVLDATAATPVLFGLGGDDSLDGAGANGMAGGAGDDQYTIDHADDRIFEAAGEGTDLVRSAVDWTLGAHLEHLTLLGRGGLSGTGNALANTILGTRGANLLDGGEGNDTLRGGDGTDTLIGGAGADRLVGGLGPNRMEGGAGDDTYIADDALDRIVEQADEGYDRLIASISLTLVGEVERLSLVGTADLSGTGNTLDNRIDGQAGANILDGGAGNDTLYGGLGQDTLFGGADVDWLIGGADADVLAGGLGNDNYAVDDAGDTVVELAGEGYDRVIASVSLTLADEVERLTLTGTADLNGAGNTLDNRIGGNSGANILDGGAGNDSLSGGLGQDTLLGGAGVDRLDGGADADVLTGGASDDVFRFMRGQTQGDVVLDFAGNGPAAGDRLEFRGYGTAAQGADFVQIDATSWLITSADALTTEVITFANAASLHSSDWSFL
jgi:Ca2+-binding RTX toxin-like protein